MQSSPPRSGKAGLLRGMSLALVMHALLIGALAWSTRWKSSTPVSVEAELWSLQPQSAAPAPAKAAPPPQPPQVAAPKPEPRPEPRPEPKPTPKPAPKEEPKPDIAIAKQRELERKQKLEAQVKQEAEERQRLLADKQARDLKLKAEREKREQTEDKKLQDALQKEREEKLAKLTSGNPGRGAADANKGFSSGYEGRIAARIKPNITYGGEAGAFRATVEIRLSPDGSILSSRITKRSGNADWDTAVLRAVEKTAVVPKDTDGRVPPYLELVFDPRN